MSQIPRLVVTCYYYYYYLLSGCWIRSIHWFGWGSSTVWYNCSVRWLAFWQRKWTVSPKRWSVFNISILLESPWAIRRAAEGIDNRFFKDIAYYQFDEMFNRIIFLICSEFFVFLFNLLDPIALLSFLQFAELLLMDSQERMRKLAVDYGLPTSYYVEVRNYEIPHA